MLQLLRLPGLVLLCCFCYFSGRAQGIKDPTHWHYSARQTADGDYEMTISVQLDKGWHIWSMKPEGDGMQIPPSFELDKSGSAQLMGPFVEIGARRVESVEGIDKPVAFFSDSVTYVTHVKASPGSTLTGKHEYQVCNDQMCLPPVSQNFRIVLPSKK